MSRVFVQVNVSRLGRFALAHGLLLLFDFFQWKMLFAGELDSICSRLVTFIGVDFSNGCRFDAHPYEMQFFNISLLVLEMKSVGEL